MFAKAWTAVVFLIPCEPMKATLALEGQGSAIFRFLGAAWRPRSGRTFFGEIRRGDVLDGNEGRVDPLADDVTVDDDASDIGS